MFVLTCFCGKTTILQLLWKVPLFVQSAESLHCCNPTLSPFLILQVSHQERWGGGESFLGLFQCNQINNFFFKKNNL